MNPFALDGATFLWLYAALILVAAALLGFWQARETRVTPVHPTQLQIEHWALLAGGSQRLAEVAFIRLLADDVIYWNEEAIRYEVRDPQSTHPVAKALLQGQSVKSILNDLAAQPSAQMNDLERWGLCKSHADSDKEIFRSLLVYGSLLLFGLARVFQGASKGKPVGYLFLEIAVLLVVWILTVSRKSIKTAKGHAFLSRYEEEKDHLRRAPPREDIPTAVALGGFLALNGTDFGHALWAASPERYNRVEGDAGAYTYMDSCSSGGSGGGDSGGSDGGGSGCGGCGGD